MKKKPKRTPKRRTFIDAVRGYCNAWKNQDWMKMSANTSRRWRMTVPNPVHDLKGRFDNLILVGCEVNEDDKRLPQGFAEPSCMYEIPVKVFFWIGDKEREEGEQPEERTLLFNVLCETQDGNPNRDKGDWGVNPISTLRGIGG